MGDNYHDGFLDAMFAIRDLVEEWLPDDPDSFNLEFWALCEEVTHEQRGPEVPPPLEGDS